MIYLNKAYTRKSLNLQHSKKESNQCECKIETDFTSIFTSALISELDRNPSFNYYFKTITNIDPV